MKSTASVIMAALLLALAAQAANAGNVVGLSKVAIPANADVRITVPFTTSAAGTFSVTATGNGGLVNVSGSMVGGAFANAYYARFISGGASGLWSTISTNGSGSVTLADTAVVAFAKSGDTFRIYKHQTIGSLFPDTMLGLAFDDNTTLLLFSNDRTAMQQNRSASAVVSYYDGYGWYADGVDSTTPICPETQLIVRNGSSNSYVVILFGQVPDYNVAVLTAPGGDLNIGTGYPVPVVLNSAGLDSVSRTVLIYDNTTSGINKSAIPTVGGVLSITMLTLLTMFGKTAWPYMSLSMVVAMRPGSELGVGWKTIWVMPSAAPAVRVTNATVPSAWVPGDGCC